MLDVMCLALLRICDSSLTCGNYNAHMAHPWSPFPFRWVHPGPGPHMMFRRGDAPRCDLAGVSFFAGSYIVYRQVF